MSNFDLKKYLAEGRLLKENTVNNKYVVKDEELSDSYGDFYRIDTQKALDYLSQFDNEDVDAEAFIDDDEYVTEQSNNLLSSELDSPVGRSAYGFKSGGPEQFSDDEGEPHDGYEDDIENIKWVLKAIIYKYTHINDVIIPAIIMHGN